MAETPQNTADAPTPAPEECPPDPDRTAALIGLCLLTTQRVSATRTVGPAIQRAALAAIYPYQGEILTLEYVAGVLGCDYKTAQAAISALEQQGFVVSKREQKGKACRYRISDERLAESCDYLQTAKGNGKGLQASRQRCEDIWEATVGRGPHIPPEGRQTASATDAPEEVVQA